MAGAQTMLVFGVFQVAVIVPIALVFLKRPPEVIAAAASPRRARRRGRRCSAGRPTSCSRMLAVAAFCCCMPMSMPQAHLVALCSDLGIKPTHGAAMLSLLLGTAFFSRQMWGWISDRIGGLITVLIGSIWQFFSIVALALTQDEIGLFTVTAIFGLGFCRHHSGLCAGRCANCSRRTKPAGACRSCCACSGFGMASGGWFAGLLYDHFGYYAPAFAAGLIFNAVNLLLIGTLVARRGGWFGGRAARDGLTDSRMARLERSAQHRAATRSRRRR